LCTRLSNTGGSLGSLAPPDECTPTVVLPPSTSKLGCLPGQHVPLLVPTANRDDKQWLQSLLQGHVGESKLVSYAYEADMGVEQYDDTEMGIGTVIIAVVAAIQLLTLESLCFTTREPGRWPKRLLKGFHCSHRFSARPRSRDWLA